MIQNMSNPWDANEPRVPAEQAKRSFLVRIAFKTGLVHTTDQAHKLLLVIAGVLFTISLYLLIATFRSPEPAPPPPEDDTLMGESEWEVEYEG